MSDRNGFGNDSHCVLLTHASETLSGFDPDYFTDSSSSSHTCYLSGTTEKELTIYKFGNQYLGDTNGSWSVTGHSLEDAEWGWIKCTGNEEDWDFGYNDFTIDFWLYIRELYGTSGIYGSNGVWFDNDNFFGFGYDNSSLTTGEGLTFIVKESGINTLVLQGSISPQLNRWYHVALTRYEDTFKLFFDGIMIDSAISSSFKMPNWGSSNYPYLIGSLSARTETPEVESYSMTASYDEFRISKGICRWGSDFTPPEREY